MKSKVEDHFDKIAGDYDYYKKRNAFYYQNLKKLLTSLIPRNKRVFEVGCGTGDLLVSLRPKYGYGIDISSEMIRIAKAKNPKKPQIHFSTEWPNGKFDYIFMSDVIEHLENPKETFQKISKLMNAKTVFINTMANPIWEPLLMFWEKMSWKMPEGKHKRIEYEELRTLVESLGLKVIGHDYRLLVPLDIPFISGFLNKHFEGLFKKYAFIEYFKAAKS